MSDEQDKLKLSLEPPKLFGRKKRSDATGTSKSTSPAPATERRPSSDEPASPDEDTTAEIVEEPVVEELSPKPVVEPEPVIEATPEPEPEPTPQKAAKPAPARPAPAKQAAMKAAAVTAPAKKTTAKPAAKPAVVPATRPAAATTAVEPAVKPAAAATKASRPRAKLAPDIEPEPITRLDEEDAEIAAQADEPPLLPFYPAAAVTGVVIGAAMVLMIWASLRGCEAVRDTSSCTGGPGFLLLVATFVLSVLLGSALLKVFSIPDPGSSSFLAVGLIAVVALLFLIEVLDHWSMLIVIPIVGVGAYLASVWVTRTFVEDGETG